MISVSGRRHRNRWLLPLALVLGMAGGLGLGLLISWQLWPVEYVDVGPDSLKLAHREEYLVLIAMAYTYDGDLGLARARLAGLGDPDALGPEVATLAERYVAHNGGVRYIQALTALAYRLGYQRAVLAPFLPGAPPIATWTPLPTATPTATPTETPIPTPTWKPTDTPTPVPTETSTETPVPTETPTATSIPTETPTPIPTWTPTATGVPTGTSTPSGTPVAQETPQPSPTETATATQTPTRTPRPTLTPTVTATPRPRYAVVEQRRSCEGPPGRLVVTVLDAEGQQKPNVELFIRWGSGDDHFFTGLKPELGVGYADFALQKGETYQVEVVVDSEVAQGIVADECQGLGRLATWYVAFRWTVGTLPP